MTTTIPGLEKPDGGWRAFASLAPEAQAERLRPWLDRLRAIEPARWVELAERARLPLGEVVASPFGLRAIALAVRAGATTVDRETRALLDWDVRGLVEDPSHGVWESGRLHVGKYQAFLQDAPFATYDPAHIAKWGPHELMHRAAGFCWRPDASRFELYLGARLNELLPVALWYGPDQLLRLREAGFVRATAAREAPAADAAWLEGTDEDHLRETLPWLRDGLAHVAVELDAIDRERASGRCIRTPHRKGGATLDASSDAVAYVVAHAERLADPAVAEALEQVTAEAAFARVDDYRAHVESVWEALLFGDLHLEPDAIATARTERSAWDLRLRRALVGAMGGDLLDEATAAAVEADGLHAFDLGQLHDGVLSVAPATADRQELRDEEWLEGFAFGPAIRARAPLGVRLERFLEGPDPAGAELARFEHLVATAAPGDRQHLADGVGDRLARDDAFALHRFAHDVAALHAGAAPGPGPGPRAYLVGRVGGEVSVVPTEPPAAALWARLEDTAVDEDEARGELGDEWVDALLEAGAFVRTR